MGYTLGIDIGIASIGFAGVNHDLKKILFSGVHIFEAAENPKDGSSLATPRREKRGSRRVFRRRSQRKIEIRKLLQCHGIKNIEIIDEKYSKTGRGTPPVSPWELRRDACKRLLTDEELARTLFHIAKHRGFQSNKKSESNEGDEGKALKGASDLYNKWIESGEPTIGAFIATLPKKRNGNGSYDNFIKRDWLREEIKIIFELQRKFGSTKTTPELLIEYSGTGKKDWSTPIIESRI
jgi:CRISPR-associated endonuclease Csn1